MKSDHTRRFPAHYFLYVGLPSQTCRTNNKRVISSFKFGCPRLTLKEGPKVKSDNTERFPTHDFLYVGLPCQTSRINNKRVISTFKFGYPRLTLKEGSKVNSDNIRQHHLNTSQHMISYRLVSHCKPLGPIIREI